VYWKGVITKLISWKFKLLHNRQFLTGLHFCRFRTRNVSPHTGPRLKKPFRTFVGGSQWSFVKLLFPVTFLGLFWGGGAFVTVHHERKVKRETNKMQLIWSLFQLSISTCFGHHFAHLQENKTVCYCIRCSALIVLDVVVWSWAGAQLHTTTASTITAEHRMQKHTVLFSWRWAKWCPKHVEIDNWNKLQISCILLASLFTLLLCCLPAPRALKIPETLGVFLCNLTMGSCTEH